MHNKIGLLAGAILLSVLSTTVAVAQEITVIKAGSLFDSRSGDVTRDVLIVVEDDRIVAVMDGDGDKGVLLGNTLHEFLFGIVKIDGPGGGGAQRHRRQPQHPSSPELADAPVAPSASSSPARRGPSCWPSWHHSLGPHGGVFPAAGPKIRGPCP